MNTVHLDYVMEFPQVLVEKDLYIKTPKVFELDTNGGTVDNAIKLHKNMYLQKQYFIVWYQHIAGNIMK